MKGEELVEDMVQKMKMAGKTRANVHSAEADIVGIANQPRASISTQEERLTGGTRGWFTRTLRVT